MTVNPYDTPPESKEAPQGRSAKLYFAFAAALALAGFVIGGPGYVFATSAAIRQAPTGARYATYDFELTLFGFDIDPWTAQILAASITPLLLVASGFLVARGIRALKRVST